MPLAVDTNVLTRLATGDSAVEHAAAEALFAKNAIFIPVTVLLETEWVLRSRYGYAPKQFLAYASWLLQHPGVEFGDREAVSDAMELHAQGFDFADALHLVGAGGRVFATFDRALVRRARSRRIPVRAMLETLNK